MSEGMILFGNGKALHEQGQVLSTTNNALKKVDEEYQPFSGIAISCSQFINAKPVNASLRATAAKHDGAGVRVSINGRDGRASCFLTHSNQVDELITRLEKLKDDVFGPRLGEKL